MANLSNYLANKVLDAVFGVGFTKPATVYFALCTSAPTAASTGTTIVEPVAATQYGGYARVAKTNNATNFPDAASQAKSNGTAVTFPVSTGGASSPVVVTHWAVLDAATLGNLLTWGALTTPRSIANGVTPSFGIGDFDLAAA